MVGGAESWKLRNNDDSTALCADPPSELQTNDRFSLSECGMRREYRCPLFLWDRVLLQVVGGGCDARALLFEGSYFYDFVLISDILHRLGVGRNLRKEMQQNIIKHETNSNHWKLALGGFRGPLGHKSVSGAQQSSTRKQKMICQKRKR